MGRYCVDMSARPGNVCSSSLHFIKSAAPATMYRLPSVMSPGDRTTGIYGRGFRPTPPPFALAGLSRLLHPKAFLARNVSARNAVLIPKGVPQILRDRSLRGRGRRKLLAGRKILGEDSPTSGVKFFTVSTGRDPGWPTEIFGQIFERSSYVP